MIRLHNGKDIQLSTETFASLRVVFMVLSVSSGRHFGSVQEVGGASVISYTDIKFPLPLGTFMSHDVTWTYFEIQRHLFIINKFSVVSWYNGLKLSSIKRVIINYIMSGALVFLPISFISWLSSLLLSDCNASGQILNAFQPWRMFGFILIYSHQKAQFVFMRMYTPQVFKQPGSALIW